MLNTLKMIVYQTAPLAMLPPGRFIFVHERKRFGQKNPRKYGIPMSLRICLGG